MPSFEHAEEFTSERLLDVLADADVPVLVDFWEPRCSACRSVMHTVDDIACRADNRAVVGALNVREHPEVARKLGVEVVPTLLVFRDGTEAARLSSAEKIQAFDERLADELFGEQYDCA